MKKNLIKVTIILSMLLLTLIPLSVNAATSGTCGENLTWTLDNGTLIISGTGKMDNYYYSIFASTPPSEPTPWDSQFISKVIINEGVTSIGRCAFYRTAVSDVSIADSVKEIGYWAFYNTPLDDIVIPSGVEEIGERAFAYCTNLSKITFSEGLKSIGYLAFNNSAISTFTLPTTLEKIGDSAFSCCYSLKEITIPENVKIVEKDIFYDSLNLSKVYWNAINANDLAYGESIFHGYKYGTNIEIIFGDKVKKIPANIANFTKIKEADRPIVSKVVMSDSVEVIGVCAFENCRSLYSVVFSPNITEIGYHSFYACHSLTKVTIPKPTTQIGDGAFYGCTNLEELFWNAENVSDFKSSSDSFLNAGKNKSLTVFFGDTVKRIPAYTFYSSTYRPNIKKIYFNNSIEEIGVSAFSGCTSIHAIEYNSSKENWDKINIQSGNTPLSTVAIDYIFPHTITEKAGNQFVVTPTNIPNGSTIIFVCYNDKQMVYVEPFTYAGESTIPFTTTETYDKVKVMVWDNLKALIPLCAAEYVPLN